MRAYPTFPAAGITIVIVGRNSYGATYDPESLIRAHEFLSRKAPELLPTLEDDATERLNEVTGEHEWSTGLLTQMYGSVLARLFPVEEKKPAA